MTHPVPDGTVVSALTGRPVGVTLEAARRVEMELAAAVCRLGVLRRAHRELSDRHDAALAELDAVQLRYAQALADLDEMRRHRDELAAANADLHAELDRRGVGGDV